MRLITSKIDTIDREVNSQMNDLKELLQSAMEKFTLLPGQPERDQPLVEELLFSHKMNSLHQADDALNPTVIDKGKAPMRALTKSPPFPLVMSISRVNPILIDPNV